MRILATLTSLLIIAFAGHGPVAAADASPSPDPVPSAVGDTSLLPSPVPSALPVTNPICAQAFVTAAAEVVGPSGPGGEDDGTGVVAALAESIEGEEPTDSVSDRLDAAIRACASIEDWSAAAQLHPDALLGADAMTLLAARCSDASAELDAYATCRSLVEALATPSPSPTPTPEPTPKATQAPKKGSSSSGQASTVQVGADGKVRLPRRISAKVAGATSVRYFKIGGQTGPTLVQQTQKRARRHCGSHRALACVNLRWQVQTTQTGPAASCTITGAAWTLSSVVHLPRWSSPKRVDPDLLKWWRKVLNQSARHEAQHIKIQRGQLTKLRAQLIGKPCSSFDRLLKRAQRRSSKAQDAFDTRESTKPLPPLP